MTQPGKPSIIGHEGVVERSDNNSVTVKIISTSACSSCHAEGVCSVSGKEEKIIEVTGHYDVSAGDRVTVLMKQSDGFMAVFLGYILPLFVVIATLIILSSSLPELEAGIGSVFALIPYYLLIWIFRKRIGKKFTFTIKA